MREFLPLQSGTKVPETKRRLFAMKYKKNRCVSLEALRCDVRLVALATKPKQSIEPSEVLARELKLLEQSVAELFRKVER